MRARRISILVLIILLVAAGIAWLVVQQPKRQTISLPDGSQLTLLKVTYGTNHVCRYGSRLQDLLHPILPQKLRAKFPPRVITFSGVGSDTLMVWLRQEGGNTTRSWPEMFFASVTDEHGLELPLITGPTVTRALSSSTIRNPATSTAPSIQIGGWELREFPRRAGRFALRIYYWEPTDKVVDVGEFTIRQPRPQMFPTWRAEPLPATRQTNKLEITLTRLETGLTSKETGHRLVWRGRGEGAKSFSRATFMVKENGVPTEHWSACSVSAGNATGEVQPGEWFGSQWQQNKHTADFEAALWLEESAWKLEAGFARTGAFPTGELWVIKGVKVPQPGELLEMRMVTNIYNEELEFLGVSGSGAKLPESYAGNKARANIHVRTRYPISGVRLALVEVRDDQGRKLEAKGSTARISTGGRGNTPKEMLHGFGIEIPEDAKSLDITLATTRIVSVEFLAKPALTESARKD